MSLTRAPLGRLTGEAELSVHVSSCSVSDEPVSKRGGRGLSGAAHFAVAVLYLCSL